MVSLEYRTATQRRAHVSPTQAFPAHALVVGAGSMLVAAVGELAGAGWSVSVVSRDAARIRDLTSNHPRIYPLICDYTEESAYETALSFAFAERGAPTLAIVRMHAAAPEAPQHTAQVISRALDAEQRYGPRPSTSAPASEQPPDETQQPPGETRQPPDEPRQPPGETRHPPGEMRPGTSPTGFPHGRAKHRVCRFFHLHGGASRFPGDNSKETGARVEFYRRTCSLLSHILYRAVILDNASAPDMQLSDQQISSGVLEAIQADQPIYRIASGPHP